MKDTKEFLELNDEELSQVIVGKVRKLRNVLYLIIIWKTLVFAEIHLWKRLPKQAKI